MAKLNATPGKQPAIAEVRVSRWRGGQHPTQETIRMLMVEEGLRPYAWAGGPNARHPLCSHGYAKVLYCAEGSVEVILPDIQQQVTLQPGDRMEIPRGVRYALVIGGRGAKCIEGQIAPLLS